MSKETEPGAAGTDLPKSQRVGAPSEKRERRDRDREDDRPRRRKRPKKPVFRNEDEINSPSPLTMWLLGAVALMTVILWGFARGACNYHPPRETRRPRTVKTEELARDPKGAAIELIQRLGGANFAGATELATGSALERVESEKTACEANAGSCAERRKKADRVITTGVLLERDSLKATVRVKTERPGAQQETLLVTLGREGTGWKVSSFEPDTGQFKPSLASSAPSVPLTITTQQVAPGPVPDTKGTAEPPPVPEARP
jgi:hypothetical protein